MSASKRLTLFCVLSLLSLLLEPLQAYGVSPFSGLEVANSQNPPGAKVFAIKEDSLAPQSDLRINDVITSIERQPVSSLEDFVRISNALKDKEGVSLTVNRWGTIFEIRLDKKSALEKEMVDLKEQQKIISWQREKTRLEGEKSRLEKEMADLKEQVETLRTMPPATSPVADSEELKDSFTIFLGVFKDKDSAIEKGASLKELGYKAYVIGLSGTSPEEQYRLVLGSFKEKEEAEKVLARLHNRAELMGARVMAFSEVTQTQPETRVQAEPQPKRVEVKTVQKGFVNPVVPNATGVTYRHGQYPSEGNNTHPGIDIAADCGSPIYAFADGEVMELIKDEKDRNFNSLGYMVIVKHSEPINGRIPNSLYLHMKEPPAVSKGQKVKAGDVIGKVGDTGNAKGCHVHFELRHFPDRFLSDKGWNYPLNIYGKGDQRNENRFLENWEDPEVYFVKYPMGMASCVVLEGERIEDYFPMKEGAYWEYQVLEEKGEKESASIMCEGSCFLNGQIATRFSFKWGTDILPYYYKKEGNTILLLGMGGSENAFELPIVFLREPIILNSAWDTAFKQHFWRTRIEGKEKVKVPYGKFEAIKVSLSYDGEIYSEYWYAKGIGLIREVKFQTLIFELKAYQEDIYFRKYPSEYIEEVWGGDLSSNPFLHKGKTIKVTSLKWFQMISETKAIMLVPDCRGCGSWHPGVVLSGIRPEMFKNGMIITVIVKVIGTTRVAVPFWGEINLPELEFVR